jgi:hypothetical protein
MHLQWYYNYLNGIANLKIKNAACASSGIRRAANVFNPQLMASLHGIHSKQIGNLLSPILMSSFLGLAHFHLLVPIPQIPSAASEYLRSLVYSPKLEMGSQHNPYPLPHRHS